MESPAVTTPRQRNPINNLCCVSFGSKPSSKMSSYLPFVVLLLTLPKVSQSACHGSRTSYRAEFMGKLNTDNRVLVGHVIATFSVKSFTECFTHCDKDCRCRSFNLPMSGEGDCELNSADNSTVLTKPKRGWRYHHLQVKEVVSGADTCYEPYSNGCCTNTPCSNDATCTELGDRGKPGFNCTCANEYNTGPLCERQINSCFDYLWNNKTAKSGYYDIWEKETLVKSTVYCDMRPDELEAWTLVMSYIKGSASEFESAPFYVDAPRDETHADSGNYRLSLARMQSIQKGMSGGHKVEWKATCGYSFADGQSTSDDVVRNAFHTLDLFSFKTHGKLFWCIGALLYGDTRVYNGRIACLKIYNTAFTDKEVKAFSENWECPHEPAPICHRVDYIKIRGHECYNCNVWATQTNTEIFSINAYRGDKKCEFNSGSTTPDENIFGVYKIVDASNHACASSNDATTQYWFGGRL